MLYTGEDRRRLRDLKKLARIARVPLIAVNDALYHQPERRELQDIVTCIREHVTLKEAGTRLQANAERHLKPPEEMRAAVPGLSGSGGRNVCALRERSPSPWPSSASAIRANRCRAARPPDQHLRDLTEAGLKRRYPARRAAEDRGHRGKGTAFHRRQAISRIISSPCMTLCSSRASQGILCQGRGSAANSVVCYAIGVTAVDPTEVEVLFERFLNTNRREPPDIDVDFEHERREEVIQYIYRRYGHRRAALTATVIQLSPAQRHPRSGQGVRPDRRRHRQAGRHGVGPSWR